MIADFKLESVYVFWRFFSRFSADGSPAPAPKSASQIFDPGIATEAITSNPSPPPTPQKNNSLHSFGAEETQVVKRELNDRFRAFLGVSLASDLGFGVRMDGGLQ